LETFYRTGSVLNMWAVWNWHVLAWYIGWRLCQTESEPGESSFLYTDFQFYVS